VVDTQAAGGSRRRVRPSPSGASGAPGAPCPAALAGRPRCSTATVPTERHLYTAAARVVSPRADRETVCGEQVRAATLSALHAAAPNRLGSAHDATLLAVISRERSEPPTRVACSTTWLALAALLLTGCARPPGAAAPEQDLVSVRRFVENGIGTDVPESLERGATKFLASTAHPVLTSVKPFPARLECGPADAAHPRAAQPCRVAFSPELPDAPFAIFETILGPATGETGDDPAGAAATAGTPGAVAATPDGASGAPVHQDHSARRVLVPRGGSVDAGKLTPAQVFFAHLFPVAPLPERALTTESFVVPAGALLRLSIGVDQRAWTIDSAPVSFRVVGEDDNGWQQDLFHRMLDPARRLSDRRWFDSDVDLSDLAGRKLQLRFVSEPAQSGDTRPSLPLWGDPRVLAPGGRRARPSIVLISVDTLRAKSMSTYGAPYETSPHMTALAAQGALFEHAYSTFSNTLPSHMSMLTGLYPATHGVVEGATTLAQRLPTLAELLRAAGYATAAFTEDAMLDSRRGFARGFSSYYENTSITAGAGDAAGTFGRALEWAGRNTDESFFLFVHTYEVHAPYQPPEPYAQEFSAGQGPGLGVSERAYLQEIRYLDDVLQRLIDGLRAVVPERDLLIVVTADHGEEFFEHGMITHVQLFDEVMHVPLMMLWPGRIPAGLRIPALVSLVDVTPTILDLAGVAIPPTLDGKSLAPLLQQQPGELRRDAVFGESPRGQTLPERFVARSSNQMCMLNASGSGDVCYDLTYDPGERLPIPIEGAAAFQQLHGLGSAYRARAMTARQHTGTQAPAPTPAAPRTAVEEKLRALGYAQ
jgi:arylsulfatase A-like enzyme